MLLLLVCTMSMYCYVAPVVYDVSRPPLAGSLRLASAEVGMESGEDSDKTILR